MASVSRALLMNGVVDADAESESISLNSNWSRFIGVLSITNFVSGEFCVAIQHSPDKVNWSNLISFAPQKTANELSIAYPIHDVFFHSCLPYIKAVVDVDGVSSAAVKVELFYDEMTK